jgi:2-dehydro-3-deoxyphosphooctonate aldolase (KDO 8-P synthase)
MTPKKVNAGGIEFGNRLPFVLIAGPCVIENRRMILKTAERLKDITDRLGIPFVFKASYDKANRTSIDAFRGPGLEAGLEILNEVKRTLKVPVLSDVHTAEEARRAADVLDILQIPAFLCRQTDLIVAAAETGRVVNVKKGQFLAPEQMLPIVKKIERCGNRKILLTERGASFGYGNLVTDFRALQIMAETGYPVVFDATHSVQLPGGLGEATGGLRKFVPLLSRCALAAGCAAIFMEVHPTPNKALSDGPNMLALKDVEKLLIHLKQIDSISKR